MRRIRHLLVLALLTATTLGISAQDVVLRLDSIIENGTPHFNQQSPIGNNDSVEVVGHLINQTGAYISAYTPELNFKCTYKGISIDTNYFYWIAVPETLAVGDSLEVRFYIINTTHNPLPSISPGGGSVVIWPIYQFQNFPQDSIVFTLIYADERSEENGELIYVHNSLKMVFTKQEQRIYELYDISGRKLLEVETDDFVKDFNMEPFATGVYVLRVRQGTERRSFKFSKY